MPKDYYDVLGVSKSASEAEVKGAYRRLAREWHPDVAKGKPDAEQKFKEINEAYQVLGDPQKRKQYDQLGHSAFAGGQGGGQGGFGFNQGPFTWTYTTTGGDAGEQGGFEDFQDPFDIFEQVFGFRGYGGNHRGRNIRYTLAVDFVDAVKGFEETISVEGKKLKVKLPPGVREGTSVKFAGKGEDLGDGTLPGDLYISIQIKPHPEIARRGADTFAIQEISMAETALGGLIPVKVVDPKSHTGFTEKKVKIPSGTQPGTQIRIKGQGMPNPGGLGRGDHYITIKVNIPKRLSRDQKKALEENFCNPGG